VDLTISSNRLAEMRDVNLRGQIGLKQSSLSAAMALDARDTTRLYFNLQITNPATATAVIPAKFKQDFTQTYLDTSADFDAAIIRLTVNLSTVPYFQFQSNYFYVTLSWRGLDYFQAVTIEDWGSGSSDGAAIFWVNQFLSGVNVALKTAYQAVCAANTTDYQLFSAFGHQPYMQYDEKTQLFSMVTDLNTWEGVSPTNGAIYFNTPLMMLFVNFPNTFRAYNGADHKDNQLRIKNRGYNLQYPGGSAMSPANWYPFAYSGGTQTVGNVVATIPTAATPAYLPAGSGLPIGTPLLFGGATGPVLPTTIATSSVGAAAWPILSAAFNSGDTSATIQSWKIPVSAGVGANNIWWLMFPQQMTTRDESPSVPNWMTFTRIVVKTEGKMPCRMEALPTSSTNSLAPSGDLTQDLILTDYTINPADRISSNQVMLMIPQPQYRWIDMLKEEKLRSMDLEVWAYDATGTFKVLVLIEPGFGVNGKWLFDRKTVDRTHLSSEQRIKLCGGSTGALIEHKAKKQRTEGSAIFSD